MKRPLSAVLPLIACMAAAAFSSSCTPGQLPAASVTAPLPETPPPASPQPLGPSEETETMLDMREANIVDVSFAPLPDGMYRFDVTLVHDDPGEAPSYADRWVVEDLAGNLLGERILLHAHGSEPFTRSATIFIPESIRVVIIRGHDALHGFGGQAMRLDLQDGTKEPITDPERE